MIRKPAIDDINHGPGDAYDLILKIVEDGVIGPGGRLVESELADRLGVSRTPVREALKRLETQGIVIRDGRSLIVASLDHDQLGELYAVRMALEGLAARLAAQQGATEEARVLRDLHEADRALAGDPAALARANRRFHSQIHRASHNRYLIRHLGAIHQAMALMASTSLAAEGRAETALAEHEAIVAAIEARRPEEAEAAMRAHLSRAYETRLKLDARKTR